jgi:hypothetical protein
MGEATLGVYLWLLGLISRLFSLPLTQPEANRHAVMLQSGRGGECAHAVVPAKTGVDVFWSSQTTVV